MGGKRPLSPHEAPGAWRATDRLRGVEPVGEAAASRPGALSSTTLFSKWWFMWMAVRFPFCAETALGGGSFGYWW